MLYNSKTDYPFWLRDCVTQAKILKASIASMDFICEIYRPALLSAGELLTYLNLSEIEMNQDTRWVILTTIHELHREVDFYQNILKQSFPMEENTDESCL